MSERDDMEKNKLRDAWLAERMQLLRSITAVMKEKKAREDLGLSYKEVPAENEKVGDLVTTADKIRRDVVDKGYPVGEFEGEDIVSLDGEAEEWMKGEYFIESKDIFIGVFEGEKTKISPYEKSVRISIFPTPSQPHVIDFSITTSDSPEGPQHRFALEFIEDEQNENITWLFIKPSRDIATMSHDEFFVARYCLNQAKTFLDTQIKDNRDSNNSLVQ